MDMDLISTGQIFSESSLDREFRNKRKNVISSSIPIDDPIPDGWDEDVKFKKTKRVTRDKRASEILIDEIFCLFYRMGMTHISSDAITPIIKAHKKNSKKHIELPISLIAYDLDNVFFIKCCANPEGPRIHKSIKEDIKEFADNAAQLRVFIKRYADDNKRNARFIIATRNIIVDDEDEKLIDKERHIVHWDEYDIMALHELTKLAGEGSKYQLYNRLFYGQKVKNFEIKIPAIKSKMGKITYYLFSMQPEHLLKIAFVNTRAGNCSFIDLEKSYQRMINKGRIKKIRAYVENGGFFPGSIILNFTRPLVKYEEIGSAKTKKDLPKNAQPCMITLPPYYGSAWIIDGQHRIYGYADSNLKGTETVPVVAFVKQPPDLQAKMFVDINHNQKSVEPDLLWDLWEDLYFNSTDPKENAKYMVSKLVKELNSAKDGPFYEKIRIPSSNSAGFISMTTICNSIARHNFLSDEELFGRDSRDNTISYALQRINAYFEIFRQELPDEWNARDKHFICSNTGVAILMGILKDILDGNMSKKEKEDIAAFKKRVKKFLDPLLLYFLGLTPDKVTDIKRSGGTGGTVLRYRMEFANEIRAAKSVGFCSRWLEDYEDKLRKENLNEKKLKGLRYYLDKDEDSDLEIKGYYTAHLKPYLDGKTNNIEHIKDLADKSVLKTVVAFLNSDGGVLLIGVLEANKFDNFEGIYESKLPDAVMYNNYCIIGLEYEYQTEGWDEFYMKLIQKISSNIDDNLIGNEVNIQKLHHKDGENIKDVAVITVEKSESVQHRLRKKDFYIRRGNQTVLLEDPSAIIEHWKKRNKR
ncbi:MAG: DGQHR domain-containing protein [Planctomycetota bacterium]|jgi:DNA sulfur modification protein DndB